MKFWFSICELITIDDIHKIANADYGMDFDENFAALLALKKKKPFFPLNEWVPKEVLELTRWGDINKDNSVRIGFSAASLLIGAFHDEESEGHHPSINENIIRLLQSCKIGYPHLLEELIDFYKILSINKNPDRWIKEMPFLYLAISMADIFAGNVRPGVFSYQDEYISSYKEAVKMCAYNNYSKLSNIFKLTSFNHSKAIWRKNLKESKLYLADPTLTSRSIGTR